MIPLQISRPSQGPSEENQLEVLVKHVHSELARVTKDKDVIDFYEFVMDPHSFEQTVDNIFHLSFLVKERKVVWNCY